MPELLIHNKTKIVFQSTAKNKTKYKTNSGAIFPIHECTEWKENFPQLAIAMPPEVGQVVSHGEHVFIVQNRTKDRETERVKLWHEWDATTRTGLWYWMDECALVTDELIEGWVESIALERVLRKEDTPEYRAMINRVPAPIRDLCIVRSFNKVLCSTPIKEDADGCFQRSLTLFLFINVVDNCVQK